MILGTPNTTDTAQPNHISGLVPDSMNLPYDMSVRDGIPMPGSSQFTRHMAGNYLLNPFYFIIYLCISDKCFFIIIYIFKLPNSRLKLKFLFNFLKIQINSIYN